MGRILVVDDERSIRVTVKAFLEAEGHTVQAAEDAESALSLLRSGPFDVVLTDIILPRVSGVELLRRIRDISPGVQVIMMTGEPTLETASESLRLGAVDYLQKPVGKNEILKVVGNALRVKQLSDEKQRLEDEKRDYLNHLEELVGKRTQALAASEAALRSRAAELSALNQLARKVNESDTVEDAIRYGLKEIVDSTTPDLAIFFLKSGDNLVLKDFIQGESAESWQPEEVHRIGKCLCGLAAMEGTPLFSSDINRDGRCNMAECKKTGFQSFAAIPLKSGKETIGVLGLAYFHEKHFEERLSFLEAVANEMAIGLKKSLLYEEVQRHVAELRESLCRIEEADSERRKLEDHLQRSQKLEAIGTLSSGIAHDFNNILSGIVGYTELVLLDMPKESQAGKNLRMVLTAADRAKGLIQQILAFSRQTEEERRPIKLSRTVKEVLSFIRASLPATIEIRNHIDPKIDNILADPVQIHQVFMNLCTNAHHAMRDQGGVLQIRLTSVTLGSSCTTIHPELKPGRYVKASVMDTGHGMDGETQMKIFDPYFTTKEKGVGTGLGLSVVHGIVQSHGGVITVMSSLGKGTEFDLYFPAILEDAVSETGIQEDLPRGNERILFVDDEQFIVDVGRQLLTYLGYRVETRTAGLDALALFKSQPHEYDLVVTDMTMPQMTGDKLAKELIGIRPDIPIVICTGYSEKINVETARAIGIKALVMKPILMAKLAHAVRAALDGLMEK